MRPLLLLIAALAFAPLPVLAQEESDVPAEESQEETEIKAEEAGPVDWVAVESTGTISDIKSGAFEKTLWKDQKRSDIYKMITELPNRHILRSALNLQRRLLLTTSDASLIENDVEPGTENDLLIARINKLMDMGLYDDAWTLYTQKAENPYDVSIAQLGMLLLVMKNDLPTACLEEKVFAQRFPEDDFFKTLDAACNDVLGGTVPDFKDSTVLQSVYHDDKYAVGAASYEVLAKMTDLERALVLANGKIRYDGLTRDILAKTPSTLVSLYLMDKNLPEAARAMIKGETDFRGLSWHIASVAQDPEWKKAKDMGKDKDSQWPLIDAALKRISNPADLIPYADMIATASPKDLSTDVLINALGALLVTAKPLPEFWLKAAQQKAAEKPIIYIYLQAFHSLTPTPDAAVTLENLKKGFEGLKQADGEQIIAIIGLLDKTETIVNNLNEVYDKEIILTSPDNYVMPSGEVKESEADVTALKEKQIGITVMTILNGLAATPDNMYSGSVGKALMSLLNVGLIEDARLMGAETIARILNKY